MLRKIDNNENNTLTDLELYGLKGPLKEVMEKCYYAFPMQGKIFITRKSTKRFDILHDTKIIFNETGKEIDSIDYIIRDKTTTYTTQEYSNDGLITKSTKYENETIIGHSYYTYDDKKRSLEDIYNSLENNVTYRTLYEYNDHHNKISKRTTYKDGQLQDYTINEYFDDGSITVSKRYDANDSLCDHHVDHHNQKGHTIKTIFYKKDGTIYFESDNSQYYNEDGTQKKNKKNLDDFSNFFVQKEIDHHGNFTKLVLFHCKQPFIAFTRDITYFQEETPANNLFLTNLPFTIPNGVHIPSLLTNPITEPIDNSLIYKAESIFESPYFELPTDVLKTLVEKSTLNEFAHIHYYTHVFKDIPSPISYRGFMIDAIALRNELDDLDSNYSINEEYEFLEDNSKVIKSYTLRFPDAEGYLVFVNKITKEDATEFDKSKFEDCIVVEEGNLQLGNVLLLCPSEGSPLRQESDFESDFQEIVERCMVYYAEDDPHIFMVEVQNSNYILKSHNVKDDFEIDDLDLHYGFGFRRFHQELMERIETDSKGLILFHGAPGTGKTYYIRHLLREIAMSDNIVIYMPPNMVDYLINPAFMTFLAKTVARYNSEDKYCILLIEDAEPLLVAREADTRIQGITNLLNMTDGLLNDMLKMQIICTFNVDIKHLDPALLRPGRLLARKEFKPLPELEANILAQSLGVDYTFTAPATLAEIYAKRDDHDTIIHDEYR